MLVYLVLDSEGHVKQMHIGNNAPQPEKGHQLVSICIECLLTVADHIDELLDDPNFQQFVQASFKSKIAQILQPSRN